MKFLHVFTLDCTPRAFFDGQFKYLAEEGDNEVYLITSSEEDREFCKRNHLTYHQIPLVRAINIKADLKSILELKRIIKREKFDAVFGHTPKGALIAMIASRLAGVKNRIYYRHGYIYTTAKGLKRAVLKNVERLTACCASKIINVSPSIGKLAVKDHINSDKKQIVIGKGTCGGIDTNNLFNPNLISKTEILNLKQSLGITRDDFVVGFCGRICKEKGIRELIDGFNLFKSQNPAFRAKLLLVGGYDERDILPFNYKNEIDKNPDIISTGNIEKINLAIYYSLMDVFVFPSYREGFGMSVIEAGAMEVPALVSRSHGCVDSIVEGETGLYIEISKEGVYKGLNLMKDPELRMEMGKNSRNLAMNEYDYSILWPQIISFYQTLK